ncbi:MAG: cobalt ECF transporter T component CbiQ [Hyphomicrobiales bacterium]|nr:MAG: cobalt ECF transporter T component CbiQ [Hyphomicrobiales bacterium]
MGHVLSRQRRIHADAGNASEESLVARVDPRVRILAAVAFAVTTVSCSSLGVLALALGAAVTLMLLANLPVAATLKRMAAMDGFIVFILLLLPFTVPGEPVFTLWGFEASREGFVQAIAIGLTANAVVLSLMALVGSMEAVTLGHALHALKVQASLVHLLLFTVRYIEVLHQEYLRLRTAMKARGFRPSNSLHTYRSFGYLVGMMLVRALERSERIMDAMKCRGFTGSIPMLSRFALSPADAVFGLAIAAIVVGLLAAEHAHVLH